MYDVLLQKNYQRPWSCREDSELLFSPYHEFSYVSATWCSMRQFVYVKFCTSYCKGPESPPAGGLCARAGGQLIAEGRAKGSQVPSGLGCSQGQSPAHATGPGSRRPALLHPRASPMAPSILVPRNRLATTVHWQLFAISFPVSPPLSGVLKKLVAAMPHSTASTYINIHFMTWLWPCEMPFWRLIWISKASLGLSPKPGIIPV